MCIRDRDNVEVQSTPMTTRIKELSVDDMFDLIKTMSESINNNFNEKFKEQSVKFNEKFDEVKNEIRKQNVSFDRRINEISIHCGNMQEQFVEAIDQAFDKQINRVSNIIDKLKMNTGVENSRAVSYTHLDVYKRQVLQLYRPNIKRNTSLIIT